MPPEDRRLRANSLGLQQILENRWARQQRSVGCGVWGRALTLSHWKLMIFYGHILWLSSEFGGLAAVPDPIQINHFSILQQVPTPYIQC